MPLDPDGVGDPEDVVDALEQPLPPSALTEAIGIHQSDIIIRSALIAGIADLRANPELLNYVFASLPRDPLTAANYGEQEIDRAKEWFNGIKGDKGTDIRVFININPNEVKFPCVSIALQSSAEQDQEGTLSDTHYVPFEDRDVEWPIITGPFTPTSYNPETGVMISDINLAIVSPGMNVVTKTGAIFSILAVDDDTLTIDSGATIADFRDAVIKAPKPSKIVELESAVFREVYSLGCHVDSEPTHLTYLHSIIVFVLLRYRQALLEARGFERASISSTDLKREEADITQPIYSRYVSITGTVRQSWPKAITSKVTQTYVIPEFSKVNVRVI